MANRIDDQDAFFLVWNPQGSNPNYRHPSEEAATQEAERLARENQGQQFYVLQALEMRTVDNLIKVSFDRNPDIPF